LRVGWRKSVWKEGRKEGRKAGKKGAAHQELVARSLVSPFVVFSLTDYTFI